MKDAFKHQTAVDPAELADFLEALAEGARSGRLPVSGGGKVFTLRPRGLVDLNLKVRRKGGLAKVTLDLAWAEDLYSDGGDSRDSAGEEA
jgi:amphi-Trp domain-containing protein